MKALSAWIGVGIFAILAYWAYAEMFPANQYPQTAQALAPIITMTPENTLTPSPVPSPTLDLVATSQILVSDAQQKSLALQQQAVETQQAAVNAMGTAQAINLAALQVTQVIGAQEVELAKINERIQQGNIKAANANAAYVATQTWSDGIKATWTAAAPEREAQSIIAMADAKNAELQGAIKPIGQIVAILAILAFLVLCVFLTIRHNQDVRLTILREENPAVIDNQPAKTIPVTWIKKQNTAARIDPPPCTDAQWAAWCEWMLNSGSGSIATWTYKGSPFVGNDYRHNMHEWAIKYQVMAVIDGEQKLTEKGIEYCEAHKPPSPAQESPINDTPLPTRA